MVNYLQIFLKAGDEAYLGIDRIASDGTPYEAVKCFLTEESAEKYNGEKDPSPCKPCLSKVILGRKASYTEPHKLDWIFIERIKERKIP